MGSLPGSSMDTASMQPTDPAAVGRSLAHNGHSPIATSVPAASLAASSASAVVPHALSSSPFVQLSSLRVRSFNPFVERGNGFWILLINGHSLFAVEIGGRRIDVFTAASAGLPAAVPVRSIDTDLRIDGLAMSSGDHRLFVMDKPAWLASSRTRLASFDARNGRQLRLAAAPMRAECFTASATSLFCACEDGVVEVYSLDLEPMGQSSNTIRRLLLLLRVAKLRGG